MIVGVSGPQGSGKTTMLNALGDANPSWIIDPYKASRQVQEQFAVLNLLEAINTPDGMMRFQQAVLDQKHKNLLLMKEQLLPNQTLFTERTFADISAYAQLWAYDLVDSKRWLLEDAIGFTTHFTKQCNELQNRWFDVVVHLPRMPHIVEENDPRRAPATMVDFIDAQLNQFYKLAHDKKIKVFTLSAITIEDRVKQVLYYLSK